MKYLITTTYGHIIEDKQQAEEIKKKLEQEQKGEVLVKIIELKGGVEK